MMNVEAVTGRVEWLRDEVMRLGALVLTQGRHAGEVALRGGAHALTRTAKQLDTLADRIADEPTARDVASADAVKPAAVEATPQEAPSAEAKRDESEEVGAKTDVSESAEAKTDAGESAEATTSDASESVEAATEAKVVEVARGASTTEARVSESKKKHRHNRRPR